ncbi:uncharacterized protein LOC141850104 [Brevipalpus obovatus]|uniref:uncharacterized protein LOC141850104 n=1 Tax=Brevipalpus obovatus TaxID=246614 RepID=UPI003D9E3E26
MANMEDGLVRLVDSDPCSITNIAQYIEDYIDLVENIPNDIARHISRLHEFNNRYYQLLAELDRFWDFLATSHCNGRLPNGHYPDTSQTTSSSLPSSSSSSLFTTTTTTTTNTTAATNPLSSSSPFSSASVHNNNNHHQLNGTSVDHHHHHYHHHHHLHNNDHDTSRTPSSSTSIANSRLLCSKESSATTSNPFSSTSISGNPCTTSATIMQTSLSSTSKSCTESVTNINSISSMSVIQVPGSVTDCSKDQQQTTSVTTFDHRKGLKAVYNLRRCLIEIQEISDEKLFIVQSILDLLDGKARQLDFDHRNITIGNLQGNLNSKISGFSSLSPLVMPSTDSLIHTDSSGNSNNSEIVGKNNAGNSESIGGEIRSTTTKDSNMNVNHSSSIGSSVNNGSNSSNKRSSSRRNLSSSKSSDMANGDIISNNHKRLKRGVKGNNKDTRRNRSNKDALNASPSALYEDPPIDPDEPTYCSCEQISYGEMICCDNTHCPIEWFHFACVSLTTKPKGKWYCPNCRGDRSNIPRR